MPPDVLDKRWVLGVTKTIRVGILGATSMVGNCLLPLLLQSQGQVVAYSRRVPNHEVDGVIWRRLGLPEMRVTHIQNVIVDGEGIANWISVAPIWALPNYFSLFEAHGARRVIVLSSTSRFTKVDSSNPEEKKIAHRLLEAEERVKLWAGSKGVEWIILRPTLIYGLGLDRNISEIARFIRRFGFFPIFGRANGLRQPIHVEDVAGACIAALESTAVKNRSYNISGGEILSYREMVARIFSVLGYYPKLLKIPLVLFRFALASVRWFPRYRHWSVAMAERMNQDLVFDHAEAAQDLGFSPRIFVLEPKDLPS